jgi:hypothetical protein
MKATKRRLNIVKLCFFSYIWTTKVKHFVGAE